MVASALDAIQCNDFDVEMFMSPSNGRTFRHELATTRPYKGNRDRSHRPTYEKEIRDFVKSTWPTVEAENEEADDLLGIRATELGEDCVIISVDKDLDQIPGKKYNLMHGVAYDIDAAEAEYRFAEQLLVGDQSDNVPGLPRIGKKKAQTALHSLKGDSDALWLEVVSQYMAHSPTEDWQEYMLEQGRLLYIRRQPGEMWQVPDVEDSMEAFEATEVSLYADEATVGD
jgi:5'-3' exonuclease